MKKNIYIVVFFTILATGVMKAQKLSSTLTPGINIVPSYEANINGIVYDIAVDASVKKLFITTNDTNFKLNGKAIIGRTLSSFENKADIKLLMGWGYYLKLDEDWYAGFRLDENGGDDSKVKFVFQYKI